MVSTFTTAKAQLEKPAAGDDPNTWWLPANANYDAIDGCLGGTTTVAVGGSDITLTASQSKAARIRLTGTATTPISVMIPSTSTGLYVVQNDSLGSAVTIKTTAVGSTGIVPTQGLSTIIFSDSSKVVIADDGEESKFLPLAGGAMTGALTLPTDGLAVGGTELLVSGGNVSCSGSFTAGGDITAFSDRRLKRDIETINNALGMVKRLRGVRYKRKSDGVGGIGVIAQEVQEVAPELVHEFGNDTLGVAYGNICGLLIQAIKELEARVTALEAAK